MKTGSIGNSVTLSQQAPTEAQALFHCILSNSQINLAYPINTRGSLSKIVV